MRILLALILSCFAASAANVTNLYVGQQLYVGMPLTTVASAGSAAAWSPTNISNMAYFWNYHDLGYSSTAISTWTDEIQGKTLGCGDAARLPTNTFYGVRFNDATFTGLSNSIVIASNFSFWCCYEYEGKQGNVAYLYGDNARNNGFVVQSDKNQIYIGGSGTPFTGTMPTTPLATITNTYYDLVWANGATWTNGVSTTNTTKPSTFTLTSVGSDKAKNFALRGYIKYIGFWTNYALTSTDVSNVHVWVTNQDAQIAGIITSNANWVLTNGAQNVTSGLVAWWKLDENAGSTISDSSGNGWSGYLTNWNNSGYNPVWTNATINSGLLFGGNKLAVPSSTNFCVIPNSTTIVSNLSSMSASVWIRGQTNGAGGDYQSEILSQQQYHSTTDNRYPGWNMVYDDSTMSAMFVQSNADTTVTALIGTYQSASQNGVWHHFCFAKDSTGTNLLQYVDGVCTSTNTCAIPVTNYFNGFNLTIGWNAGQNFPAAGANSVLYATIDDVRIYNRVLTASEVRNLYKWGKYFSQFNAY